MENSVSIIIPCYNNGYLLAKMLECILRQTYKNWQLIIVDDCSTDNTQEVIHDYVKKDDRIIMIVRNKEPKGAQTCRNIGIENAKGKFIVMFDADDLISNTCLEKRVEFMDENLDIDYASFPAKSFTDENKLPLFSDKGKKYGIGNNNTDILSDLLKANFSSIGWTNIYRTKSLLNLRWDEKVKVYQDFDFAISIILAGLKHKFSNSCELDYFYRVGHGNTISSDFISDEKCNSTIYLFSKVLNKLKQDYNYKQRKKELTAFIILHFERIIVSGSQLNTKNYIDFCGKYYGTSFINILKFISRTVLLFNNITLRKLAVYFLVTLFHFKRQSASLFVRTLISAK